MINNAIIIFGGTGDLSYRKLYPALYDLSKQNKLENFKIIGIGRKKYTDDEYKNIIKKWCIQFTRLDYDEDYFEIFNKKIIYYNMDFTNLDEYKDVKKLFENLNLSKNLIYYYAVSPEYFQNITTGLSLINDYFKNSKIIVEKPFGKDLKSAKELNKYLKKYIDYNNIYYIDHYLGKEMLLNIMTIRFFNSIFNGVWNRNFIDNIQINVFETVGVETRGGYYDKSGAVSDMLQNHLFQILSIVAMDEPIDFENDSIKEAQTHIFKKMRMLDEKNIDDYIVLGQYDGYTKEDKVDKNSKTETFVALKLFLDNERWKDVPFYLRTGKKLKSREIQIIIQFKPTKSAIQMLSNDYANADLQKISENNYLAIKIQPDEGIRLNFNIKKPGTMNEIEIANLDYCQSCITKNIINTPQAYERLLESAINSNKSLFSTWEQIELSWEYMNNIMDLYKKYSNKLYKYEQGTYGPIESNVLIEKDGRRWINS